MLRFKNPHTPLKILADGVQVCCAQRLWQSQMCQDFCATCQRVAPTESKVSVCCSVSWQALCLREGYLSCWQVVKQIKPLKWWLRLEGQSSFFWTEGRTLLSEANEVFCVAVTTSRDSPFFESKISCFRRRFIFSKIRPCSRYLSECWMQLRVLLNCAGRSEAKGSETLILQTFLQWFSLFRKHRPRALLHR